MMHVNTWGVKGLIKLHSNLVGYQLSALKAAPTDIYWSVLLVPEGFSQISSENSAFLAKGIEVGRDENVLTIPLWFLAVLARGQFAA